MFLSEQMKGKERRDMVWGMLTVMAEFYRHAVWLNPEDGVKSRLRAAIRAIRQPRKPSIVNRSSLLLQSPELHSVFLQICSHVTQIPSHTYAHTDLNFLPRVTSRDESKSFFFSDWVTKSVTYLVLINQQCHRSISLNFTGVTMKMDICLLMYLSY